MNRILIFVLISKFCLCPAKAQKDVFMSQSISMGSCQNVDFEGSVTAPISTSTQVDGWVFTNAVNNVPGVICSRFCDSTLIPINSLVINHSISSGYIDTLIGSQYPLFSVFGSGIANGGNLFNPAIGNMFGNSFLRLSSPFTGSPTVFQQVSKKIKVSPVNNIFKYAYVFVGRISATPCCIVSPLLKIRVTNISKDSVIGKFSNFIGVNAPDPNYDCQPNNTNVFYNAGTNNIITNNASIGDLVYSKWKVVELDLTEYMGDSIKVDFCVNDNIILNVDLIGRDYAYIDAQCKQAMIYCNGNLNQTGEVTNCSSVTLSAIPNYTYSWNGPTGSNVNNVITQSISVSVSGVYSLTLFENLVAVGVQTIQVNILSPAAINVLSNCDTVCSGQACQLKVVGSNLLHPIFWSNGAKSPTIIVTPTVTNFYYVHAVDSNNCISFAHRTIYVKNCVGLQELYFLNSLFYLYPNPALNEFTIEFANTTNFTKPKEIKMIDVLGREVKTLLIENKTQKINIEELSNGVYYLQLQTPSGVKVIKKLVKE
jgi:hypothetical protein